MFGVLLCNFDKRLPIDIAATRVCGPAFCESIAKPLLQYRVAHRIMGRNQSQSRIGVEHCGTIDLNKFTRSTDFPAFAVH